MVDSSRQAGAPLPNDQAGSGDMIYALGDRGVVVPQGMTAEMVLAGAKVLRERLESYAGPCCNLSGAEALACEMWKAIAAAAAKPSAGILLSPRSSP